MEVAGISRTAAGSPVAGTMTVEDMADPEVVLTVGIGTGNPHAVAGIPLLLWYFILLSKGQFKGHPCFLLFCFFFCFRVVRCNTFTAIMERGMR